MAVVEVAWLVEVELQSSLKPPQQRSRIASIVL